MQHDLRAYAFELLTLAGAHGLADRTRAADDESLPALLTEIDGLVQHASDNKTRALLYCAGEAAWRDFETRSHATPSTHNHGPASQHCAP